MKSWNSIEGDFVETPQNVCDFLNEIGTVCLKYNISISHEDGQGSFILEKYDKNNIEWLFGATISIIKDSIDYKGEIKWELKLTMNILSI